MPLLLVVGATPDAGEEEVAAAIAGGATVTAVPPSPAAPLVAARHAGTQFDPGALASQVLEEADAADGVVAAVLGGGLLGPLTPRFSVRDLAAQLHAPLVLAARAEPGALNAVRITAEAARGAGLAVAAVVLTGWPDPPGRAQLDERALLHELTTLPVLVHGPGAPAPDWDVEEWLGAAPTAPAVGGEEGRPGEVVLEPYQAWEGDAPGDPRSAPRPRLMDALEDVVATEGPMVATRAYALVNRAAGGRKLTTAVRAPLSNAAHWLARDGRIAMMRAEEAPGQGDDVLRLPDAPPVRVRELGPRELTEVPLDEIAELMRRLRAAYGIARGERLKRAVLTAYGLRRLTARADEHLETALTLVGD